MLVEKKTLMSLSSILRHSRETNVTEPHLLRHSGSLTHKEVGIRFHSAPLFFDYRLFIELDNIV